jgi:hypothetical protein
VAAARQSAALKVGARMPEVAMAKGTMGAARRAEAKLVEARIPEAAMVGVRMLEARPAEPKMAAPAATVPDWNLPAEVRSP